MLTPNQVLHGYTMGIFPMADPDEDNVIHWYEPKMRGIIPLDSLKISKSLRKTLRDGKFECTVDQDFQGVMRGCAEREQTWISEEIIDVYTKLHEAGWAHSFECRLNGELVGGLYGVAIEKAFFGESMFSKVPDASKVALVCLVQYMRENGFLLLDTQYVTDHLKSMGAIEIDREQYLKLLHQALR